MQPERDQSQPDDEPVVDLDTWEKAGRAVVATVPIETCRGMSPETAE